MKLKHTTKQLGTKTRVKYTMSSYFSQYCRFKTVSITNPICAFFCDISTRLFNNYAALPILIVLCIVGVVWEAAFKARVGTQKLLSTYSFCQTLTNNVTLIPAQHVYKLWLNLQRKTRIKRQAFLIYLYLHNNSFIFFQ